MSAIDSSPDGRTTVSNITDGASDIFERKESVESGRCNSGCYAEEDGYKRLILAELNRRKLTVAWLERPTKMHRTNLNRIIRGSRRLTDDVRHICFEALQIDQHQAYITVAMLKDIDAYHKPTTHFIAQNLRAVQQDVCDARRGQITDFFRPAIINQAAKVGVDSLLKHQERIEEIQRSYIVDYA